MIAKLVVLEVAADNSFVVIRWDILEAVEYYDGVRFTLILFALH